MIVDTSNEIAGDSTIPHPVIGRARRMMVPARRPQSAVLLEAVKNHTPELLVCDEIGNREEGEGTL